MRGRAGLLQEHNKQYRRCVKWRGGMGTRNQYSQHIVCCLLLQTQTHSGVWETEVGWWSVGDWPPVCPVVGGIPCYTMVGGRWPPVWPATDLRDLRNPPQSPVGPRRGKFKARVISALLLLISKPSLVLSFSLVMVWGKIKTSKQSENGVEFYLISCLHLICMFDGLNLTLPCHVFFCWRKGLTFA